MNPQIILTDMSGEVQISDQEQRVTQTAIKTINMIFSRNRSLRFQKNKSFASKTNQFASKTNDFDIFEEKSFVPKLKSKQLLGQPKFFFGLQKKKLKLQNSCPSFQDVKYQKLQMKGSKVKKDYLFMTRTNILIKQSEKSREKYNKSTSPSRKTSCKSSSSLIRKEWQDKQRLSQLQKQKFPRKLSHVNDVENGFDLKKVKRPNLYENISFLIKRRKQMKNKISLKRINNSKFQMAQGMTEYMTQKN